MIKISLGIMISHDCYVKLLMVLIWFIKLRTVLYELQITRHFALLENEIFFLLKTCQIHS